MRYILPALILISFSFYADAQPFAQKPSHFWIDLPSTNQIYDDQVLQLMGRYGAFDIMHVHIYDPQDTFFNARSIINRSHQRTPGMPMLMYTYTTAGDTLPVTSSFIPGYNLQGYKNLDTLLLHNGSGQVLYVLTGGGLQPAVLGDVRKPAFIDWITTHVADSMFSQGFDGIASDLFHPAAHAAVPQLCNATNSQPFCQEYLDGVDTMTAHIKAAIGNKPFIFNGLLNAEPFAGEQLQDLQYADGATVEFFGYSHYSNDSAFTDQILPFINQIRANPQYHIFVNGRGKAGAYVSTVDDYRWQRYLYASYLLARNNNTTYHYFVDFAIPNGLGGRSTPLDIYDDINLPLGVPADTFKVQSGVYYRPFANGLVAVVPNTSANSASFTLAGTYYTPEGAIVSGTQTIPPGTGLILLNSPLPARNPVVRNFDGPQDPTSTWQFAQIAQDGNGNRYLHVNRPPNIFRHFHDLMLDWLHSPRNFTTMQMDVRSSDNAASINVVADVDDSLNQNMQVVFTIPFSGTVPTITMDSLPQFRVFKTPRGIGNLHQELAPFYPIDSAVAADGVWHTIYINADSLLKGTGYTIRRFSFCRLVGSLDIDNVRLPDSMIATGIRQIALSAGDWEVYPNPATSAVSVQLKTGVQPGDIIILTDISGRILQQAVVAGSSVTFNTTEYGDGLYFTSLIRDGIRLGTKKIVICK